jgi:hypothetical protein
MRTYSFSETIWKYHGDNAWYFITLPSDLADEIKALTALHLLARRGFGSLRVSVTIGSTTWNTSIFPDNKTGSFLLPIKKAIRIANHILENTQREFSLTVLDI